MVEKIKLKLFRATTEKMFLHGSTTWSLTKAKEKKPGWNLYKNAANMENISWKDRVKKSELYCSIEKVTFTIQNRRIALSGHVFRDEMSQSSPAQC